MAYASEELARDVQPRTHHWCNTCRHRGRYVQMATSYVWVIRPRRQLAGRKTSFDLESYVGSDWACCTTTRASTKACVTCRCGCCVGFHSHDAKIVGISQRRSKALCTWLRRYGDNWRAQFSSRDELDHEGHYQVLCGLNIRKVCGGSIRNIKES